MGTFPFRLPWMVRGKEVDGWAASVAEHERALVVRLGAGELAALGEAYDAHHARLRAFARRLCADHESAEDLVQETFIHLPAAARRFRGEATLRTLLLSIAARRAARHVRGATRRRAAMARLEREPGVRPKTPEEEAIAREQRLVLARALDDLSLSHRLVLVLCDVEGRSSVEAGQILGIRDVTVRTRLFVARKKLRERLERE